MKKQMALFATLLLFGSSVVHGQTVTAYAYVQQNGTAVTADGTASIDVSSQDVTMAFDSNGNGIMYTTSADAPIAKLPITDGNGGELCTDFTSTGTISATVDSKGYATYYSPFKLTVGTGDVKAYVPTYDADTHVLACTDATNVNGKIIPAGTGLLLKSAGTINFTVAVDGTAESQGALSGSALQIAASSVTPGSGNVIYTLGYKKDAEQTVANFGFYEFNGTNLSPAKAYLIAAKLNSENAREYIGFDFGDGETTEINNVDASTGSAQARNGKYIENNRVVIVKNNKKYNLNGQEVK